MKRSAPPLLNDADDDADGGECKKTVLLCNNSETSIDITANATLHCDFFKRGIFETDDGHNINFRICLHTDACVHHERDDEIGVHVVRYDATVLSRTDQDNIIYIFSFPSFYTGATVDGWSLASNLASTLRFFDFVLVPPWRVKNLLRLISDKMIHTLNFGCVDDAIATMNQLFELPGCDDEQLSSTIIESILHNYPLPTDALTAKLETPNRPIMTTVQVDASIARRQLLATMIVDKARLRISLPLVDAITDPMYHFYQTAVYPRHLPAVVMDALAKDQVVVAGGAAMREHPSATHDYPRQGAKSDIDLYVLQAPDGHQEYRIAQIARRLFVDGYTARRFQSSIIEFHKSGDLPIQLIKSGAKTTRELIDGFDLIAVRCAIDETQITCTFQTFCDIETRSLRGGTFVPTSLTRMKKMLFKGFYLTDAFGELNHHNPLTITIEEHDAFSTASVECGEGKSSDIVDASRVIGGMLQLEEPLTLLYTSNYTQRPDDSLQEESVNCKVYDWKQQHIGQPGFLKIHPNTGGERPLDGVQIINTLNIQDIDITGHAGLLLLDPNAGAITLPLCWTRFGNVFQIVHDSEAVLFDSIVASAFQEFGHFEPIRKRRYPDLFARRTDATRLYINGVRTTENCGIPILGIARITAVPYAISTGMRDECGPRLLFEAVEICVYTKT